MMLTLLFIFIPVPVVTLLSVPLFRWIKNKTKQSLITYLIATCTLSLLVGFSFIALLILLGDNPIDGALTLLSGIACYGLILGWYAWYLEESKGST